MTRLIPLKKVLDFGEILVSTLNHKGKLNLMDESKEINANMMKDKKLIKYMATNPSEKNEIENRTIASEIFGSENIVEGFFKCKNPECPNMVPASKVKMFDTPKVKGCVAYLCDACWEQFKKIQPKVPVFVCKKCHSFLYMTEPTKVPRTGFEYKAGHFYHLLDCPHCNPEFYKDRAVMAPIEEAIEYDMKIKQKIEQDRKIFVQENKAQ